MQDNEEKVKDGFQHTVLLVATYLKSQKAVTQPGQIHQIFNKHFEHIDDIVDNDVSYNQEVEQPKIARDYHILRNIRLENFKPQECVEYLGQR